MTRDALLTRLRAICETELPLPAAGQTALRHRRLMAIGREDLSLARLAEGHFDAVAILAETGFTPKPGAIYGVWASERPGHALRFEPGAHGETLNGTKMFCSGSGIVTHALVTAGAPDSFLVEVDLAANAMHVAYDNSAWKTTAFAETGTAAVTFSETPVSRRVGEAGWYVARPGFWHGACGPAACWAGGAAGLLDYANRQQRSDAHAMAHLGAMHAAVWSMEACLDVAGREIDAPSQDTNTSAAHTRALTVRHLVEQACTEILRRLPRAYGPYPLALDEEVARRYQELDLYLRQSHAERDLETLGRSITHQRS